MNIFPKRLFLFKGDNLNSDFQCFHEFLKKKKKAMTQGNLGIHPKIAHLKNSMQHCEWELYLSVIINNALIHSQSFQFGRQRYDNLISLQ